MVRWRPKRPWMMTHVSCHTVYDNEKYREDVDHDVWVTHVYKSPSQTSSVPTDGLRMPFFIIRLPIILIE